MHAVNRLYRHRKSLSTTEFKSRGMKVKRCEKCRIALDYCICALVPKLTENVQSNTAFLLLMYDTEVLKPSNTGRLIADLIPDTFAFLWSRTEPNPKLLTLLADEQWQPYVVFPAQYAEDDREVVTKEVICQNGKRPLFIMLDGSWREATKMFRKSPYLSHFPMVSFDPEKIDGDFVKSRYQIRSAAHANQWATAEVAARVLSMAGESNNAQRLDLWFDVFNYQYQKSVCQRNLGNPQAIEDFHQFIEQK
jgi:DTW domain-containing protein YfiP